MQAAVVLLGNASQHHAVQCRQVILNSKLKSLIKDEDFRDAPPFLFGECLPWWQKNAWMQLLFLKKQW